MNVKSIVVEQIDWTGTTKSLMLEPDSNGRLIVAFPPDYEEPRTGPFYFQSTNYQNKYDQGFAECRSHVIAPQNYFSEEDVFTYKAVWQNIPTEKMSSSYYALYLPEYAIPVSVEVLDPFKEGKEFRRTIIKDNQQPRYIVYLQCVSQYGVFTFNLKCRFKKDELGFAASSYTDKFQQDFYAQPEEWKHYMNDEDKERTQHFFAKQIIYNNHVANQEIGMVDKKNNPWGSGSFYIFIFIMVMATLGVLSNYVPWAALPIILIAGILSIGVIGAMQLRNDDKLKEENFVKLMIESYKKLLLLRKGKS